MSHPVIRRKKLRNRVRRLSGQIDAIERALDNKVGTEEVMRLLTAARGAISGIMAEVVEDHVRTQLISEDRKPSKEELKAADELLDALRTYIR
jgi:DNA-binding FrmR family transcriptional regulator